MEIARIPRLKTLLNAPRFLRDPISLIEGNIRRYGDTYRFQMGKHPGILTANPGMIQHVLQKQHRRYIKSPPHFEKLARYLGHGLLTSDGAYWLKQRRLIQPGFHRQRIAGLHQLMDQVIADQLDQLDERIGNAPVDIYPQMQEMAFQIIARSIFNLYIGDQELAAISHSISALQRYVIKEIRTPFLSPWLRASGQQQKAKRLAEQNDTIILRLIQERKTSGKEMDDLLQMLLDARYEDGSTMSNQQLLDEVKILFVAGHDTSANALAWTWHLLTKHPEWLEKLRAEVDQHLQDQSPELEDLRHMPLLHQVIQEAMRLYPPAWITDRMAREDDIYQGITIPKGTLLVTFFYGAHHHPDHWENPYTFRPERFTPERKKGRHPAAYLPFGAGPRLCIGNSFAMLEMQLVLAKMIQRYRIRAASMAPVRKRALVTLQPGEPVLIHLDQR